MNTLDEAVFVRAQTKKKTESSSNVRCITFLRKSSKSMLSSNPMLPPTPSSVPDLKSPHALAQAMAQSAKCRQAASLLFPVSSTTSKNDLVFAFEEPTMAKLASVASASATS